MLHPLINPGETFNFTNVSIRLAELGVLHPALAVALGVAVPAFPSAWRNGECCTRRSEQGPDRARQVSIRLAELGVLHLLTTAEYKSQFMGGFHPLGGIGGAAPDEIEVFTGGPMTVFPSAWRNWGCCTPSQT